jgi:DNA helicase HerA-like ATPase
VSTNTLNVCGQALAACAHLGQPQPGIDRVSLLVHRDPANLAAQARKYGLGLIFATQAPKGLHNRVPGNATTQFFGALNAPVQVEAAREMAKMKGGDVPDLSRLTAGEFYVAVEGEPPQKVRTPMCLSHHPQSPLTNDEVLARARSADDRS